MTLSADGDGTRVQIEHGGLPDVELDLHAREWAYYLGRLAAVGAGRAVVAHQLPPDLVAEPGGTGRTERGDATRAAHGRYAVPAAKEAPP